MMTAARWTPLPLRGCEPFLTPARTLLRESGCVIVAYRANLTGTAYTSDKQWAIAVPPPSTVRRFGVFAHEVGHQLRHRDNGSYPRWREELEAWDFAWEAMERFGLPDLDVFERMAAGSIVYSLGKALRRTRRPAALAEVMHAALPMWTVTSPRDVDAAIRRMVERRQAALAA